MTHNGLEHWGDRVARGCREVGELVLGIDPAPARIPTSFGMDRSGLAWLSDYVSSLLEAGSGIVAFVKFQSAYFESYGSAGVVVLAQAIRSARSAGFGVILDAKRGDIGSTATAYAQAYLTPPFAGGSDLEVDCMTVSPFLGPDSLEPFIACARSFGKGVFVLTKNSNPGAAWLQDQIVDGERVSERVARLVGSWAAESVGECGLSSVGAVVGATYPDDAAGLRRLMPDSVFLAPGLGVQGGKVNDIALMRRSGLSTGVLVPVSRSVCDVPDKAVTRDVYCEEVRERLSDLQMLLK